MEVFLALTFNPKDIHCIHVDPKADTAVKSAIASIVSCYNLNFPDAKIFTVKFPARVEWGHFSVIEADLKCMREIRQRSNNNGWKVFMNPAGSELPMYGIADIRERLKGINGSVIRSAPEPKAEMGEKIRKMSKEKRLKINKNLKFVPDDSNRAILPLNAAALTVMKGSRNVALSRDFVDFVLDSEVSQELMGWIRDYPVPDEHFYATLATIKEVSVGIFKVRRIATRRVHAEKSSRKRTQFCSTVARFDLGYLQRRLRPLLPLDQRHLCVRQSLVHVLRDHQEGTLRLRKGRPGRYQEGQRQEGMSHGQQVRSRSGSSGSNMPMETLVKWKLNYIAKLIFPLPCLLFTTAKQCSIVLTVESSEWLSLFLRHTPFWRRCPLEPCAACDINPSAEQTDPTLYYVQPRGGLHTCNSLLLFKV